MPVRKQDIPDDVMAALADPKEQPIPDDVLAMLGESKKKVSGDVSVVGTQKTSPSRFPLSQSPAKERHPIVEDSDAGSLLDSFNVNSNKNLQNVINNPFGGSIQVTQFSQSREGKAGKIISDIVERGEFNTQDINYLTKVAPKAAAQIIKTVLPDSDDSKILSKENIERFAVEGKKIVDAKITEQKVSNNRQVYEQVKSQLAENGIDPEQLKDDGYAEKVSSTILSEKNEEIKALDKLFPQKITFTTGGVGGSSSLSRPEGYAKKRAELDSKYSQIQNQIGLNKAYDLAKQNPSLTPKEIGEEWLKYADPDTYKLWVKAGKKGAIDRDIAEIGVRALYGTGQHGAVELAKADESNLDYQYPDKIVAETYHRLGAELHKSQNWFLNAAPSVTELDKAAEQLPEKNRDIYYKLIRDYEKKNIGTEVPLSGLVNKAGEGIVSTANETWKGLGDLLKLRSDKQVASQALNESFNTKFQDVGTSQQAVQRLKEINNKQKKGEKLTNNEIAEKQDLETFTGVRSTAQEIIDGTGNLTGQVLFQAIGTKGLGAAMAGAAKGVGILKGAGVAAGLATEESIAAQAVDFGISKSAINGVAASAIAFASSYDAAKRDAYRLMPDEADADKRAVFATIVGGLNALTERIFKDEKVLGAFNREISPSIRTLVGRLSQREISQAALSTEIKNVLKKSGAFLKESAIANVKESTEELATSIGQSIAISVLAPAKFNEQTAYNDAISTFTTTFLHGGLVAGAAGARALRSNHIGVPTLARLGVDEKLTNETKNFINAQVLNGNMTQQEADSKFIILETASQINKEVMPQVSEVAPDLSQKSKEKYAVQLLNERLLNVQADETKDEVLKSSLQQNIKESEKIRKQILNKEVFVDDDYSVRTAEEINTNAEGLLTEGQIRTTSEIEQELADVLGEDRAKEAKDQVEELIANDLIPEKALASKIQEIGKAPLSFLKFIAEQAQGSFEFEGKTVSSRGQTIEKYGEGIVSAAEDFFPNTKTTENVNQATQATPETKGAEEASVLNQSGAAATTEARVAPYVSKFPKPRKPVSQLNSKELEEHAKKIRDYEKNIEVEFFGEDGAKRYREARRISNSNLVDKDKQKEATDIVNEMENSLSPEQSDEFFGINKPIGIYDSQEIASVANKVRLIEEAENVQDLSRSLKLPLLSFSKDQSDEGALAVLNAAKNRAEQLKIDPKELITESIQNIIKDLPDIDDAGLLAESIFKQISQPAEQPKQKQIESVNNDKSEKDSIELGNPTITQVEDGDLYEFSIPEGKIAGVLISPTEFRIDGISAVELGKGQGTKMFESLIGFLRDKGVTTITTQSAGEGAKKMHQKAVDKGLLNKVSEDGRRGTFEIKPKENIASEPSASVEPNTEIKTDRKAISDRLSALLGGNPALSKSDRANKISLQDIGIESSDSIPQVIEKLISFGGEFTDILKFLKGLSDIGTVKFEKLENISNREGEYVPEANKAELPENRRTVRIGQADNAYYALTHEILHFLTLDSDQINKYADPKKIAALRTVYDFVSNQKGTSASTSAQYGLTDFREFMVELSMNPEFRKEISDVVATREDFKKAFNLRNPSPDGILKVITDFIKDLINKIFNGSSYNDVIDHKKSLLDNAVDLATEVFFAGQDVISAQKQGSVVSISQEQGLSNAALNNPALPASDRNKMINDFIKSEIENGAKIEDIKGALLDNGFTEDEAQAFMDANKKKIRVTAEQQTEGFDNNNKSILNRISESKNIPENIKQKFSDQLTYNPQSHSVARDMAQAIVKEFGIENSISMAEAGRFNGDVNSLIFAEGIDQTFELEQSAKTPEEKLKFAEQWADYSMRYDEAARQKGKFISAVYDFYKKSPLGIIIAERANRDEVFKKWFKNKEANYKEVFEEFSKEPEFQQFVKEKVETQLKAERVVTRMKRRKKISDIFDSAKFKGDALHSSLVPPQLWNAAVEVMKQAALAGESVANIIEQGIKHIKDNHSESWDIENFRKEWEEKLKGVDGDTEAKPPSKDRQQKILDRFRRKLSGLNDTQKEDVIRRSFKTLVDNGALDYDEFKKIVADVMGIGDLSPEEVKRITQYVKDINSVQEASDNVIKDRSQKSIDDFDKISKTAERSATELGNIVNSKTDLLQRVRSIIQLNTLGAVSLIKNPIYNVFHQTLVRLPKAIIMTGIDQALYGLTLLSNKITGSKIIKPQTNIFLAQKGYFGKGAKGGTQAIQQVFSGLTSLDYFQKEIRTSQIKPLQSWRDIWSWSKGEKFLNGAQIADKFIQGTVGIPAEAVARMLNIGDKPFRFAAEGAVSETIAKQEFGLKGIDKEIFTRFPKDEAIRLYKERGMEHEAAVKKAEALEKRIIDEGEQAVFQQKNLVMEGLNGLGAMMKNFSEDKPVAKVGVGIAKIVGTLNTPFLKTPLNIFWELFNLVTPEVAFAQSAVYGFMAGRAKYKGENEKAVEYAFQAKKWMAHAATGYSLLAAFGYFASIGAISGGGDDDTAKERKGKKTYQKAHALNIAKVMRAFAGGDTRDEDNDLMVDLSWFGAPGMIMNIQADRYENMTKEERQKMSYLAEMTDRMHGAAADGLENSIFQGTIAGINAFKQGGRWVNTWVMNQVNVGANFLQPATFAQFSRATLPYNPAIKADSFSQELKNNFASRSLLFRAFAGYPPSDITIWGDKAMRNNSGIKGVAFNMLGFDEFNKDTFAEPIFQDYKRTGNSSFFPTDVRPTMTVDGQDKKMTVEQERQFKTLVGQARKSLVAPFVNDMATFKSKDREINGKTYNELSDEQKVKALNVVYKKGYEAGKAQFKELYSDFQSEKEREEE